jgi:hypothetical protein
MIIAGWFTSVPVIFSSFSAIGWIPAFKTIRIKKLYEREALDEAL